MILDKPIADLTEDDLQALVAGGETYREKKVREYKATWPGGSDDDKREFLADVSSFANTAGGDILYGIEAKDGVPTKLVGVELSSVDAEIQFAHQLFESCMSPRIPRIDIEPILLPSLPGRHVIIIRIPYSWASPHMVRVKKNTRFHARNSNGKYDMDVGEIRSAFLRSESLAERMRNFRLDRLAKIAAGETPVGLPTGPKFVLHLLPFSAFDLGIGSVIGRLTDQQIWDIQPVYSLRSTSRYNFDGLVTIGVRKQGPDAYVQLFQHGGFEVVETTLFSEWNGRLHIPSTIFEEKLIERLPHYLSYEHLLQVDPPFILLVSLLGVKGYTLSVPSTYSSATPHEPIDRDTLLIPDILIDAFEIDAATVLRPVFNAVWNAAGWPHCFNYDAEGKRKKPPAF